MMRFIIRYGFFAVIHHVGRKSGAHYTTPVIAIQKDYGFLLALTYGKQVDWYKNVMKVGSCEVEQKGIIHTITTITPVEDVQYYKYFPKPLSFMLKIMGIKYYLTMLY